MSKRHERTFLQRPQQGLAVGRQVNLKQLAPRTVLKELHAGGHDWSSGMPNPLFC